MKNVLLTLLIVFLGFPMIAQSTLGNTEVFGSTTYAANLRAVPVTANQDGSIGSISIYHNGGSGSFQMGIYSDASGYPGTRLGKTYVANANSSEGWQTIDISSAAPVTVSAGQTIWLAWGFENNPGIRYTTGTPGRAHSSQTWAGDMPESFGPSSIANYIYSIYCSYTLAVDPCNYIMLIDGLGPENSQTFNSEGFGVWPTEQNSCGGTGYGNEQIYAFTAPVTGTYTLEETEPTGGSPVAYSWKTGSCSWEGWTCINDNGSPGSFGPMEWQAGTTYLILVDAEQISPSTHTFYINNESTSYPLGNTEVFGSTTTVANRRAVPVTASEGGTIKSISFYHNGGSGGLLLAVYSDVSGSPGFRQGVASSSTTVSSSEGWQTFELLNPVSVTAGQTVWLAWVFENNPGIRYTTGTPGRANSPETWSGSMPESFGSSTIANYIYSMYCTFSPGSTTSTLGYTEVFGSTTYSANRRAIPVTANKDGFIKYLSIYHNGGDGHFQMGIYSDVSGAPGSRLVKTYLASVSSAEGWKTIDLNYNMVQVSAGQTVWLAWVFENNPGIRYTTGTPGRAHSPEIYADGMPESFGTSTQADYIYSIYCSYSSAEDPCDDIIIIDGLGPENTQYFTTGGTDGTWPLNSCGTGYGGEEQIYAFTAPVTGTYTIETSSPSSLDVDYLWKTGSCSWEGWTCLSLDIWNWSFGPMEWEAGTTYLILQDANEQTSHRSFSFYIENASTSYPLGNTEVFGLNTTVANRRAVPVTSSEAGIIESISIYHNGGSGGMLLGVYSDASGSPGALLGYEYRPVNSSSGWQNVELLSPVSVTAGQTVWLAWVFENNPGIRYMTGTPGRAHSPETWSGGMPGNFGSSTISSYIYSIYCTFSSGGTKAANILLGGESETQDGNLDRFIIYPNPTSGKVMVSWSHEYDTDLRLTLINSIGEQVKVLNIEPQWGEIELDLVDFKAGMYFIVINDGENNRIIHRGKVIKSK